MKTKKTLPKALEYAEALADAERRIVKALPDIIDRMVFKAKLGDMRAAVFLMGRVLGKAAGSTVAPADDQRPPYTAFP